MKLSMVRIGLFKTEGLDEYGAAAVGWLLGAGLKMTEQRQAGRQEWEEETWGQPVTIEILTQENTTVLETIYRHY